MAKTVSVFQRDRGDKAADVFVSQLQIGRQSKGLPADLQLEGCPVDCFYFFPVLFFLPKAFQRM